MPKLFSRFTTPAVVAAAADDMARARSLFCALSDETCRWLGADDPETGALDGSEREVDEDPLPVPAWAEAALPLWADGEPPDGFGPAETVGEAFVEAELPLAACEGDEVVEPDEAVVLEV
jgi:hypothetical protein